MRVRLVDVARVIRSKNAGPYELTLDILLEESGVYEMLRDSQAITAAGIASLYHVPAEDVLSVIYFDPARAIKVTMRRRLPSGSPGETDVYGAQQHAPLMALELELESDQSSPASTRQNRGR